VSNDVNNKTVKLFGSGGFKGLTSYGSGIVVSPQGHILTIANQLLDTQDLRVHLSDGRRFRAKVLFTEPELAAALLVIKQDEKEAVELELEYFDVPAAIKKLKAQPGDWALAFSNSFQIATRDEPMTVQRGVISAYAKLVARRGIHEAPYHGEVFFLDQIINNPGSAGGAVTTRKGDLIGMIGQEYRNVTSDTWINYCLPLNAKVEVTDGEKIRIISLEELVTDGIKGTYKNIKREKNKQGPGAYHGIVFVPNILPQTPPYVDRVIPQSPAHKSKLQPDDLVVYVDGEPVYTIQAFKDLLSKLVPGSKIQLEVRRGEKLTAIEMELADFPKQ
ncbi:MAG: S1C family serine protease, partial [Planctomycetes bacterium]|nr:S1C family serine protease [Planctomycetota bacterium]